MKIAAFTQLHNELEKGNLENWFRCVDVCDYIYIYDQASTDGSFDVYNKYAHKTTVIKAPVNDFKRELLCKQKLYNLLSEQTPDVDWILWLDGDLLLDGRLLANGGSLLRGLCNYGDVSKINGFLFGHYNLWRSDTHYRTDLEYHGLHCNWFPLWKNTKNLQFSKVEQLHQPQYPINIAGIARCNFSVIHRGFATDYQLMNKYNIYKSHGQKGWDLDRLLDEETLTTLRLPDGLLPQWFNVTDDTDPKTKRKIKEIYIEKYGSL